MPKPPQKRAGYWRPSVSLLLQALEVAEAVLEVQHVVAVRLPRGRPLSRATTRYCSVQRRRSWCGTSSKRTVTRQPAALAMLEGRDGLELRCGALMCRRASRSMRCPIASVMLSPVGPTAAAGTVAA